MGEEGQGRMHYFGLWADPDAVLAKYDREKDARHAGRKPRLDPDALTVKDVANAFRNARQNALGAAPVAGRMRRSGGHVGVATRAA
jgi:hypothetical protein